MTTIPDNPLASRPSVSLILWRLAWPFCLFSGALTLLLTLSWIFLLPRYTRIEVGRMLRSTDEIRQYRSTLTAQIATKEEERRLSVVAVHDPAYDALKEQRRERVSLDDLRNALVEHAKKTIGKNDVVQWHSFDYDPAEKTLTVHGDIRNVGTQSMTVLASFALSLRDLPIVAKATMPAFTREEDPKTGFHSPFTITLTLR